MNDLKTHHVSSWMNDRVETTCGRVGYFDEDGELISKWHCAREEIECRMRVSHQRSQVSCRMCLRKLSRANSHVMPELSGEPPKNR